MRQMEIAEKKREEERDQWFNQAIPMIGVKQTWREKRLAREEQGSSCSAKEKEMAMGGILSGTNEQAGASHMEINMVFTNPAEFHAPERDIAELTLGAERDVFERPKSAGKHMKPLFVKGHLYGTPLGCMMVDRGGPK
jgi:hypothetical protein